MHKPNTEIVFVPPSNNLSNTLGLPLFCNFDIQDKFYNSQLLCPDPFGINDDIYLSLTLGLKQELLWCSPADVRDFHQK